MRFEFSTAARIIFGSGTLGEVAPLAAKMGRRALIVTEETIERAQPLLEQLKHAGVDSITFSVIKEPDIERVTAGAEQARSEHCDLVIAIGGGSVLDTGKAIAVLLTNSGDLMDYLEVVGKGQPLTKPGVPFIAIPTTAGTGAEVTRNSVICVPAKSVKVSIRSDFMLPRMVVVDPELTFSMPPAVTASTGLDALTHLLEAYVTHLANPMTEAFCREGLRRAGRSLQKAFENGRDKNAREDMALASLLGGLSFANTKLGAVHGFAAALGGMFSAPHGMICAGILPFAIEENVRALQKRASDSPALQKYKQIAQILTDSSSASAADGVEWIQKLCRTLQVPPLTEFGITEKDVLPAVTKAQNASSIKGNPILLTQKELSEILQKACSNFSAG
ncbi:MAG: iron-containing alcohol dehydrogenase [Sedimentisphaerales bacterium]|nr:iron-containing alcohol dehydrogenase [Sedimentisphaerales bacterium]